MYINTAEEISGVPSSWPGYNLTIGASGDKVLQMQGTAEHDRRSLIRRYRLSSSTAFMARTPRRRWEAFQRTFRLPVTGIVDYATWYKIQEIL